MNDEPLRLRLLRAADVPHVSWVNRFGHVWWSSLLGIPACLTVPAFAVLAVADMSGRQLPLLNWALLLLGLAVPTFFALWIARLLGMHVRAGLRGSNWVARLTDAGVFLQFRSWLNWRIPEAGPTAVFVPWSAIASVHHVHEELSVAPRGSIRRRYLRFDAITLRPEVGSAELRDAVRAELHGVHTHPGFPAGGAAWDDVPVFVHEDGDLWIARRDRFLLRALAKRVPRGAQANRALSVGAWTPPGAAPITDAQLLALIWRGEWTLAQMVARFRLGQSYDDAVRTLAGLTAPGETARRG